MSFLYSQKRAQRFEEEEEEEEDAMDEQMRKEETAYINLKRKPPLCFGGKSSDICIFVCLRDT